MRIATLFVPVLLAAIVAGCGGSDSSGDADQPPATTVTTAATTTQAAEPEPSHEDFIAELNAVCRGANREIAELNTDLQNVTGLADAVPVLDTARAAYEQRLEQLEVLDVPAEDQAAFDRFRRAAERTGGIVRRMGQAARDNDAATFADLAAAGETAKRSRLNAALDLGADDCGK